jgi:uncharacterized membrane protein YdjX (TVP38/TMEM64 family)
LFASSPTWTAKAWRTLAVSFVLFGGVGMVFLFGAQVLGFNGEATVERWLGAASGPWALPAAVAPSPSWPSSACRSSC